MSVTIRGSGQLITQIVQTVKTDSFATTSTSWIDVPGLSATITPTNSANRILVMFSVSAAAPTEHGGLKLVRGSTDLGIGDASGSATRATSYAFLMTATNGPGPTNGYMYLDSPATTTATTYKIQTINPTGNTTTINQSSNQGNSSTNYWRTSSTITLMEVAYA